MSQSSDALECPECGHPIDMKDIEGADEYKCPNCETVLALEDGSGGDEVESTDQTDSEETDENEVYDEAEGEAEPEEESEDEEEDEEEQKPNPKKQSAKQPGGKPRERKVSGAKNPEEVRKYLDFIIRSKNGVQAPMVAEHFQISPKFARRMIRSALKMAEELGFTIKLSNNGAGKSKTYIVTGK